MDKRNWMEFLSARLRSQIILENGEKAQGWAFSLLCLGTLGAALKAVGEFRGPDFTHAVKVLFFILFHAVFFVSLYLPGVLLKGEKSLQRLFGIYDLVSLAFFWALLTFYSFVGSMLAVQILPSAGAAAGASPFFGFVAWINLIAVAGYFLACLFFAMSFVLFPQAAGRVIEHAGKAVWALLGLHAGLALFLIIGYSALTAVGSPDFFEQARVVGLFWIFIAASFFLVMRFFRRSSVQALANLELEAAAGRVVKDEDVLERFKEAFVSGRLSAWAGKLSHRVASLAHEIAGFTHEAIRIASLEQPKEIDLRLVEDRYRRAEVLYKKMDKESRRFLVSLSLFDLSEAEREKLESVKDLFSRELRNAKLELASVRKRIDDRLEALKNQEPQPVPAASAPAAAGAQSPAAVPNGAKAAAQTR